MKYFILIIFNYFNYPYLTNIKSIIYLLKHTNKEQIIYVKTAYIYMIQIKLIILIFLKLIGNLYGSTYNFNTWRKMYIIRFFKNLYGGKWPVKENDILFLEENGTPKNRFWWKCFSSTPWLSPIIDYHFFDILNVGTINTVMYIIRHVTVIFCVISSIILQQFNLNT